MSLYTEPTTPRPAGRKPLVRRIVGFRREEDGSLLIFSLFMFVLMVMISGISLDIERFEAARTRLQATADGAALAAASLTQDIPAADLVRDYFEKSGLGSFYDSVDVVTDVNFNQVTVNTHVNVPTHFFNMIGVENLGAPIQSVAAESIDKVEITLVLDVSGSMGQNNKIGNLIAAAEDFVDAIYTNTPEDSISITVVPYSTQVSVGPEVMSHFTGLGAAEHDSSYCLDFQETDFDSTAIDLAAPYGQTVHMDARTRANAGWDAGDPLRVSECPTDGWTDMLVMSQDKNTLKNYFRQFTNTNWTSIEIGVKWGAALLDPSFQSVVDGMVASGSVDNVFAGRPAALDDDETLKVMVVMTDGINTNQFEIDDPYRTGPSPIYVWHDAQNRPYYSVWKNAPLDPIVTPEFLGNGNVRLNWYLANDHGVGGIAEGWRGTPLGDGEAVRMDWEEVWATVPVRVVTDGWFATMGPQMNDERVRINKSFKQNGRSDKDPRTLAVCSSTKGAGIVIYTIAFEAPQAAQQLLRNCASTPSHAFDVNGTQISQAFSAIAADVSRLRLVN